jgi:hypothetical protein
MNLRVIETDENATCGTVEDGPNLLPPALVETMKLVFRETHGGEMTAEDREFLGIADQ